MSISGSRQAAGVIGSMLLTFGEKTAIKERCRYY